MTFNEFLMPALPQTPTAGFKGSGAIRTAAHEAPGHAAASAEGQSFLATLKQVSDVASPGTIHDRKSISTKEMHHSAEGSAAGAGSADTSPCLLYTSPSPRDQRGSRMPSSA